MKRALSVALFGLLLVAAAPDEAWAGRGHGDHGHFRGGHHGHFRGGHHGHFRAGHHGHFRGHGHHGWHGSVWVGPGFWWGPPVWWGPHYVYQHRTVVVEEPPVYIERGSSAPTGWWYYCESESAYYPDVYSCPEPWVKVAPQPE